MSQTPLTDAYLASRCKGENKQSWVEFARDLEMKYKAIGKLHRTRNGQVHFYQSAEVIPLGLHEILEVYMLDAPK